MKASVARTDSTMAVKTTSRHKDFEDITITGYYTRDIRFPVCHALIESVSSSNESNRPLYKMRDPMP